MSSGTAHKLKPSPSVHVTSGIPSLPGLELAHPRITSKEFLGTSSPTLPWCFPLSLTALNMISLWILTWVIVTLKIKHVITGKWSLIPSTCSEPRKEWICAEQTQSTVISKWVAAVLDARWRDDEPILASIEFSLTFQLCPQLIYKIFEFISCYPQPPSSIFHQTCHTAKQCNHPALLLPCNHWHHNARLMQMIITSTPKIVENLRNLI